MCPNGNSIEFDRIYSKKIPNCVLAESQMHLIESILRHFLIEFQSKFISILSKTF